MDQRNMSMGGESIDWNDPAFSTSEFQDSMTTDSPWTTNAFNDFTNLADYSDSPANLNFRTPSKSGPEPAASTAIQPHGLPGPGATPIESSSQDSASDSSSRRKRKTTESPISDPLTDGGMRNVPMKTEDMGMGTNNFHNAAPYENTYGQPLPNLNVDASMAGNDDVFDFNSAASSPNLPRDFNQQLSLDAKMNVPTTAGGVQFTRGSPVTTINPGMFTLGAASRDQSPVANPLMYNATASPNAIFSTPSSDSNDTYNANPNWNAVQNPAWTNDFNNQFASPGGLAFTPSPVAANGTPAMSKRAAVQRGRSKLHIAPISTKSRVETQINVVMTLETPPRNVEHLHLPLHTIAKSKLLAKEDVDKARTLELHTMLVCTSAMHNPQMKEKALQRAANQNNEEIQKRGEEQRKTADEDKNNMKDVDEADKAANGGEVRICNNCIQRERKRAGRKKLKREEEQQHWERFETERVVVFNSNEYLPFKPFESSQQPQKEGGMGMDEPYNPSEGAVSVAAAMRIACYCRHQSEKEGFQVIFTMKDQQGTVVAQEMSDSILITDDHKTHPPTLTTMSSDVIFPQSMQYPANGLQTSYSMVNLSSHSQPFTSSRSTGNLQALNYAEQYNPHSHIHQLQTNNPYASQTTSATMTPTSLSRPGSPNSAGQTGPNKKRKSSNFGVPAHRRLPSGLQMTPRVDTGSQPASATQPTMNMPSNFSPNGAGFPQQTDQSFMTIPQNNGPAQYYGSGPSTPANEQAPFNFGQPHQLDIARAQNASAYFSHPSSAVPSRSNSPVLQQRQYRQPIQTSTNHVSRPSQQMYGGQAGPGAPTVHDPTSTPTITKITPSEGPVSGGTEVSIFGYNFTHGIQVFFGNTLAAATFYGTQCILAISPPGQRGQVQVRLANSAGTVQYASPQTSTTTHPIFTYTDTNARMMEMALRFLSQQQTGDSSRWVQYTNEVANQFMQTSISPAGIPNQGFDGGSVMTRGAESVDTADMAVAADDEEAKEDIRGLRQPPSMLLLDPDDASAPNIPDAAAAAGLVTSGFVTALRNLVFAALLPYTYLPPPPAPPSLPAFSGAQRLVMA